jgi:HAMP domain-containing protein
VLDKLREAIESVLDGVGRPDRDGSLRLMHEAVVEARVALDAMAEAILKTEKHLTEERSHLDDAVRRGRLAGEIDDHETVEVADRYAAKHREHLTILERKLEAQRGELELAKREFGEMREQLQAARANRPQADASDRLEAAWREIETAGGSRTRIDADDDRLRSEVDRAAREAAAEAQLERLKKKMGR